MAVAMVWAMTAIVRLGAQSQAPPSGPLSLEDCVRLAQAAPSSVAVARYQAEIARFGIKQARAEFFPTASLSGAYTYNSPLHDGRDNFSFVALNGIREYQAFLMSGLQIDTSGRLRAALERARADQDAARAGLGIAGRDLKRTVTASYYRLLLARHLVQVDRDVLTESQNFERRSRLLAEHGEVAQADVIKAGAEAAFLEQALNAAELEEKLANHDLASFWTTDVDTPLSIVDVLDDKPAPPETGAATMPFLGRLEFRVFDAQKRGFRADAKRARADLLPQTSVLFQYGIDSTRFTFADRGYASIIHLDIPLWDWFRAHSAMRQFQIQSQQVDVNSRMAERTFSRDYRDALARVEKVYAQIAQTETQVKLSEDNLRLSRVRYEGGEGTALDVVTAQTQLAQARSNYYAARANYLNARADLEVASGR
jgi:outer membrane protein TolC